MNPKKVICVHGDPKVTEKFQKTIKQNGFEALAPKLGDELVV